MIDWNREIGRHFFNRERAYQEVFLFAEEELLLRIGAEHNVEDPFHDFKEYLIVNNGDLLYSGHQMRARWKRSLNNKENPDYPYFIAHLFAFVLPLENVDGSYYDSLVEMYGEKAFRGQSNHSVLGNWRVLWEELEYWANSLKNGEWGFFHARNPYRNEHINQLKFTGYAWCQRLLSSEQQERLVTVFHKQNWNSKTVSDDQLASGIASNQQRLGLKQFIANHLQNSKSEIRKMVLTIAKTELNSWISAGKPEPDTFSQVKKQPKMFLKLFLNIDEDFGDATLYFRIHTGERKLEDVTFNHLEDQKVNNSQADFSYSNEFAIVDDFNHEENQQLFDLGGSLRFFYKGEKVKVFRTARKVSSLTFGYLSDKVKNIPFHEDEIIFILLKEDTAEHEELIKWFRKKEINPKEQLFNLESYSHAKLYQVKQPDNTFPFIENADFSPLTIIPDDDYSVRLDKFSFLNESFPVRFKLFGLNGEDRLTLILDNGESVECQVRRNDEGGEQKILEIPATVKGPFRIAINNQFITRKYSVQRSGSGIIKSEGIGRNPFGIIDEGCSGIVDARKIPNEEILIQNPSLWGEAPFNNFSETFDSFILQNAIASHHLKTQNQLALKRFQVFFRASFNKHWPEIEFQDEYWRIALREYEKAGIFEYDYRKRKIVLFPPLLSLLPDSKGGVVKYLLSGCFTVPFLKETKKKLEESGFSVTLVKQHEEYKFSLLPPAVIVERKQKSKNSKVEGGLQYLGRTILDNAKDALRKTEEPLDGIAEKCGIRFQKKSFWPERLIQRTESLTNYQGVTTNPLAEIGRPEGHLRKFDMQNYSFQKYSETFESYGSLPYPALFEIPKFYGPPVYLLKTGESEFYIVNKQWGRFKFLSLINHIDFENIYDKGNRLLKIPLGLSLPYSLHKAAVMCSGLLPVPHHGYLVYSNIPVVVARNLLTKLGQYNIRLN